MSASYEPLSSGVYTQIAMPAIWLVSLRPGVPLHTDPIDIDLPDTGGTVVAIWLPAQK